MDPITLALIATAVSSGIKAGGDIFSSNKKKKASKLRSKETHRETLSGLLNDAFQGSADLQAHGLGSRSRLGKRRSQSLQDTSDLVRGALNI